MVRELERGLIVKLDVGELFGGGRREAAQREWEVERMEVEGARGARRRHGELGSS